jgi:hypothetical protein
MREYNLGFIPVKGCKERDWFIDEIIDASKDVYARLNSNMVAVAAGSIAKIIPTWQKPDKSNWNNALFKRPKYGLGQLSTVKLYFDNNDTVINNVNVNQVKLG